MGLTREEREYECAICHEVFAKTWSDEEADAEYRELFPGAAARREPRDVVCEDCFQQIKPTEPQS